MGSKQSWNTDLALQSAVHKHIQTIQEHFLTVISAFLAICAHDMPSVRATCRSEKNCPKISMLHKLKRVGVCGRAVNTSNSGSGGLGFKPHRSRCFLRQGTLLHLVSLHPGV